MALNTILGRLGVAGEGAAARDDFLVLRLVQGGFVFGAVSFALYALVRGNWGLWPQPLMALGPLALVALAQVAVHTGASPRNVVVAMSVVMFCALAAGASLGGGVFSASVPMAALVAVIPAIAGAPRVGLTLALAHIGLVVALGVASPGSSSLQTPETEAAAHLSMAWALTMLVFMPFVAMVRHLLVRNQRELAKRATQLQQQLQAKTWFLSNASHEIRTPLNGIVGTAALLTRPDLPRAQMLRLLQVQQHSAAALMTLVNTVLDVNRLEANKLVLHEERVHVPLLLDELVELYAAQACAKEVELTSAWDESAPLVIRADKTRLLQVLANLVSNAVKFTEHGHVHVSWTLCPLPSGGTRPRFTVSDTGPGLSAEQLQTIFLPYVRIDHKGSRAQKGTGLGLVIARELATLMKGDLRVQSTVGKGTDFTLDLPATVVCPDAPSPQQTAPRQTMYLVDHSPHQAEHMSCRLRALGWSARRANLNQVLRMLAVDKSAASWAVAVATKHCTKQDCSEQLRLVRAAPRCVAVVPLDAPLDCGNADTAMLVRPVSSQDLRELLKRWQQALAHDVPRPAAAPVRPSRSPEKSALYVDVLVVDDHAINRELARATLASEGLSAKCVASGRECLETFAQARPRCVLMDLRMPDMDGVRTAMMLREIEHANGWARTTIVAVSADRAEDEAHRCLEAGMDAYLSKPYLPDELVRVTRRMLAGDLQPDGEPFVVA